MIAPRNNLLWLVAVVGFILSTGFFVVPGVPVGLVSVLVIIGILIAGIDALMSFNRVPTEFQFSLVDTLNLVVDRPGEMYVQCTWLSGFAGAVTIGLVLPEWVQGNPAEKTISVNAEDSLIIPWECTGLRRGIYRISEIRCQRSSRLKLWDLRWSVNTLINLRVYADVSHDQRRLASIFMTRNLAGIHVNRLIGKGKEFQQLREYIPGDSYEDIHWKASAKRMSPVTKIFQIEQTQRIYFAIDTSRLSARMIETADGKSLPQLESFISAALVSASVAQRMNDHYGIITFDDQVRQYIRASTGPGHYSVCRDVLNSVQPRKVNPDFQELYSFLRLKLKRRSLVVILSHLDDPVLAENFNRYMALLSRRHIILVNMIRPAGVTQLFTGDDINSESEIYNKLAGQILWHNLELLTRRLKRVGVGLKHMEHAVLCPEIVSQYLAVRRRQLL